MAGRSYVLTPDFVTVRGTATTVAGATQDPSQWVDVNGAADGTFIVECVDLTTPGGTGTVVLNIESSPFLDASTFMLAAPPLTLAPAVPPVFIKTVTSVSVPGLARFVRWRISTTGSGAWTVTFRIRCVTNRGAYFRPTQIAGCALWLRSDLGVGVAAASNTITGWADQSGVGNSAAPGAAAPTYNTTSNVNGLPRVVVSSVLASQYMTGTFASSVSNHTLFGVVTYPALANDAIFAGTDNLSTVNSGFAQFTETPTGIIGRAGQSPTTFSSAVTTDTTSLGAVGIYSTAASANGNVDIWVNGKSKNTAATAFTLFPCTNYSLFTLGGGPVQYPFNGDAYEFILFNSVLSSSDRLRVHRYLSGRYSVSIS